MSANDTSPTYRKIDDTKLSFFDLPGEVRNIVYKKYFTLPHGHFTIHLVNIRPEDGDDDENEGVYVSSLYRTHLDDEYQEYPIGGGQQHQASVLDLLDPKIPQRRTDLMGAARPIMREAQVHLNQINRFRIIGNSGGAEYYHSNFELIGSELPSLLPSIKDLEVGNEIGADAFDMEICGWQWGIWPLVVTQMSSLEHLTFYEATCLNFDAFLSAFTFLPVAFLGTRPDVYVDVPTHHGAYQLLPTIPPHGFDSHKPTPRFIVPPLSDITWKMGHGQLDWTGHVEVYFEEWGLREVCSAKGRTRLQLVSASENAAEASTPVASRSQEV